MSTYQVQCRCGASRFADTDFGLQCKACGNIVEMEQMLGDVSPVTCEVALLLADQISEEVRDSDFPVWERVKFELERAEVAYAA